MVAKLGGRQRALHRAGSNRAWHNLALPTEKTHAENPCQGTIFANIRRTYPSRGSPPESEATYLYNQLGQVSQVSNEVATYSYGYDEINRLNRVTDGRGNKTHHYTFSPCGRLDYKVDGDGNWTDYLYDATGNVTHIWAPNDDFVTFIYDAAGRLVQRWMPDGATSQLIQSYAYDPYGNRTQHSDGTDTWHYGYNAAHELETVRLNNAVTGPLTAGYVYDANGNLTKQCQGGSVTRTSSNCTGSDLLTLQYDALDRLAQADKTGLPIETYGYDDQGRRIHKTVGGAATDYLYMGPDIHAEYQGGWTQASAVYTHGPWWDDPIIRILPGAAEYYHQDGIGNVIAASDPPGRDPAPLGPGLAIRQMNV